MNVCRIIRLAVVLSCTAAVASAVAGAAPVPPEFPSAPVWSGRTVIPKADGTWEHFVIQGKGDDAKVCVRNSSDGGMTWSAPAPLGRIGGEGWGGTAAVVTPRDEVHLFMTKGRKVGEGNVPGVNRMIDLWHTKSSEERTKWSAPKPVFEGYVGAISNAVQLTSGRIILPFGMLIGGRAPLPPNGRHELTCIYSDDDGETFTMSPARLTSPVPENYNGAGEGACEPAIVQFKDGRVYMTMRAQAGFLYESWSDDGVQWSDAKPSQFHTSTGPPYLLRLKDDRIALFWNNCEMPPRVGKDGVYGGRDALHAAIADPEMKQFVGFREVYVDPTRNTTPPKKGDRGTAYPDAAVTPDGRMGVSSGQGGRRKLFIVDPAWLYETSRSSNFADGVDSWCVYKGIGPAVGWWRDRTQGAQLIDHPDKSGAKALHVRRPDENDPDGATWNFPMGRSGTLAARVFVNDGFRGGVIALADRFFDPCDVTCDAKALFLLPLDRISPGAWHDVELKWDTAAKTCAVTVDGKESPSLAMAGDTRTGVSYLRFRSTAPEPDAAGFLIESVRAEVKP